MAETMSLPRAFVDAIEADLDAGRIEDKQHLHKIKTRLARELGMQKIPRDSDLIAALPQEIVDEHVGLLRKKPTRTGSGVAIVAVMSSPAACPHGKCVYCPGGPDVDAPQSYTGFEPSTMRSKRFGYDPYRVVRHRLGQLAANGHEIDKVDIIIQGGTFPARDIAYRDWFVAGIYAACNEGPDADGPEGGPDHAAWIDMDDAVRDAALAAIRDANESAPCRIIGLTIETKPDWCLESHVDDMLRYGCTRIELGIQTLDEDVTRTTNRGHTVQDAADAMRIARNAGMKLCVHMMPGLPRPGPVGADGKATYVTDAAADREDLRGLFADPAWRPDMLKIYPTLVVEEGETPLKRWFREGRYTPLDTEACVDLLADVIGDVAPYCRIQRIDRDIPTTHVVGGVMNSNLRQLVEAEAERRGRPVHDIRSREPHRLPRHGAEIDPARLVLHRESFDAGGGREEFVSWQDPETDCIVGFLRLRRVAGSHRPEMTSDDGRPVAVVRELKVYGMAAALGAHADDPERGVWQHQGLGARLLAEAEQIAFGEWNAARVVVIAGVGVKPYYRRHGYTDLGPYVARSP